VKVVSTFVVFFSTGRNQVVLHEMERDWSVGDVVHIIMSNVISPELFAANVVDNAYDFNR